MKVTGMEQKQEEKKRKLTFQNNFVSKTGDNVFHSCWGQESLHHGV
jgi:hypothetical protein